MMYNVIALSKEFKNGRKSVDIELSSSRLIIKLEDREVSWLINSLEIEKGGAGDTLIYIKSSSDSNITLYTRDKAILEDEFLAQNDAIKSSSKKLKQQFANRKIIYTLIVLVILAIPVSFFSFRSELVHVISGEVPIEWEVKAGDKLFETLKKQYDVVEDSLISEKLDSIFKPLIAAVNTPEINYKFYVCSDPSLNAFALPGGHIVINYGTIMKIERIEELYGVIGHEIGHVTNRHHIRGLIGNVGTFLIFQGFLGDEAGLLGAIGESAGHLESLFYSRQFERESDEVGFTYLTEAGIDPHGMIEFFERIKKASDPEDELKSIEDDETLETLSSFVSTHPGVEERIEYLNNRIIDEAINLPEKDFDLAKFQKFIQLKLQLN
jgi:predicted Zn-dependent protease